MRTLLCAFLAILGGLGCARIYRPVTLATPPASVHGEGPAGQVVLQPWGDNSRYERKALQANLRVWVLALENISSADLEILRLDLPEASHSPSARDRDGSCETAEPRLHPLSTAPGPGRSGGRGEARQRFRGPFGSSDLLRASLIVGCLHRGPQRHHRRPEQPAPEDLFPRPGLVPGAPGTRPDTAGARVRAVPDPYGPLRWRWSIGTAGRAETGAGRTRRAAPLRRGRRG